MPNNIMLLLCVLTKHRKKELKLNTKIKNSFYEVNINLQANRQGINTNNCNSELPVAES